MAKTDSKIEDFADELGRLLGTAEAKARGWMGQRQQIVKTLEEIRDTATQLLADLGHRAQTGMRRGRRAATAGAARPKRRRTMSAEAREKIRQAQLKRWAKQKGLERK